MKKYEQVWYQMSKWFAANRSQEELREDVRQGGLLIILGTMAFLALLAFSGGCMTAATTSVEAVQTAPELVTSHTERGLVQIAQMGDDCVSQERMIKRIVSDLLVTVGAPSPDTIEVEFLSGSSLCDGTGTVTEDERMNPFIGANNVARAKITLRWSVISRESILSAKKILADMAPAPRRVKHRAAL
jgi:hypothetical protein